MISYKDLYILKLSGITESHNKKEFIIPNEIMNEYWEGFFTCEFLKDSKYILRSYYKDGNKWWKQEYKNGQQHGKYIVWRENGNKYWEAEFKNGQLHGKSIGWYVNGNKWWEKEYKNGLLHGKSISWYKNGNKYLEKEYKNGKLTNDFI